MSAPAPSILRATGFRKVRDAVVIKSATGGIGVHRDDFARLLSIMCEGASMEQLDRLYTVIVQRRESTAGAMG